MFFVDAVFTVCVVLFIPTYISMHTTFFNILYANLKPQEKRRQNPKERTTTIQHAIMASLSCHCGKVKLRLTSKSPRVSTECCCNSCFRRVKCLQDLGGPPVEMDKPIVCIKWDNRVIVEQGSDHLMAYKLTPDTKMVNIASSCCHTFLLGRNAEYDAHCFTTNQGPPVYNQHYVEIPPSSRWFSSQWSQERLDKLEPLIGIWVDGDGNLTGEDGWEPVFEKQMQAMNAAIPSDSKGETFEQVLESLGPPRTISEASS
jgi:hypothetical protein